jgi:hypothetical protein
MASKRRGMPVSDAGTVRGPSTDLLHPRHAAMAA